MVRRSSGHDLQIRINPAFVRENEVKVLVGSSERLRQILPDIPAIDFSETIDWMVSNP